MLGRLLKIAAPLWVVAGLAFPALGADSQEQSVTLSTQDGWELAALYLPAQEGKKTVLLLHDLGKNKEAFASFKKDLSQEGFGYLALDLRGHGQSIGQGEAYSFAKEGVDNEYNKMTRDVEAAVAFLDKNGVSAADIAVLGAGLGANVAAKSMSFSPDIGALALISPTTNNKDVLSIPAMRLYKGDILIAAGAADKKSFLEASVIRNVAFLTAGEGKVTFLTAYDLTSHEMLDKYLRPALIQWLKTPHKPEVLPDLPPVALEPETNLQAVAPSGTEEALVPSVLGVQEGMF